MIFVTGKEDELSESAIRDFPCVKIAKITDEKIKILLTFLN
jgi:hypothetical protein